MRSTYLIVVIVLLSSCAGFPDAGPATDRSAAPLQSPKLLVEPVLPGNGAPGESGAGGTSAEWGSGGRRSGGQGDAPDGGDRNSQGSAPGPGAPDHDRQAEPYVPPIDPCSVLTEGEVEALAGGQVGAPDGPKEPGALGVRRMQDCVFRSEGRQRPYIAVTVGVASSSGRDEFEEYQDRRAHAGRLRPVPGLGEEAFWHEVDADTGMGKLVILKGSRVLAMIWLQHPAVDYLDVSSRAAAIALGRI